MDKKRKPQADQSTKKVYRSLFSEIPFWQGMGFILMISLIWAVYFFNLTEFFFSQETGRGEWFGLSLITVIIIVMGFVIVAHSYIQQQRILKGIIRVCSYCRKVRLEETDWVNLEHYVSDHSLANFSHGICPECYRKVMAELDREQTQMEHGDQETDQAEKPEPDPGEKPVKTSVSQP